MAWPQVQMGDITQIVMGQSPPGETYNENGDGLPFFQGKADFGDRYPTPRKWCSEPIRIAESGDILLSVRAPVGPTNVTRERACIGRGLAAIRANSEFVEPGYLRFFLKHAEPTLALQGHGSTFTAIKAKDVARLKVPLPSLSEQRRIVDILDQADRLRRLRADADAKAARILPALFIKMFGDPATNPMGWPVRRLGDAMLETQYGTSQRANTNGQGVPVLRMNNISSTGEIDLADLKFVDLDTTELRRHLVQSGDILFNRTNSIDLVGKTGLWEESGLQAVAASYLIRVRIDRSKLVPQYVWAMMQTAFMKSVLALRARRAVGMANINATELRRLPAVFPPLEFQENFATLSASIRRLNENRRQSIFTNMRLSRNLLDRAFSGPLTTSPREA